MGDNQSQEYFLISDRDKIVRAANFAVAKALSKLNVFESEARILDEHLKVLEKEVKLKKIKSFINQQNS